MKWWLFALVLMLMATPVHAGMLEVVCVTPTTDNAGSCDNVIPVPRTGPMWVHFTYISTLRGGYAGHDSLVADSGDTLAFSRWVPAGDYRTKLWAADAGGVGCSTDTIRSVRGWPGKMRVIK